jgi:hypothetical protein
MQVKFSKEQKRQKKFIEDALSKSKEFEEAAKELANKLANKFKSALIKNIKTNRYGYALAEDTVKRKIALGAPQTPFVFTGELLKSIYVENGAVKVKKGKHSNGLSYEELWFILEFGRRDKLIPARPVWKETYKEFAEEAKKAWKDFNNKKFNDTKSKKFK